MRHRFAAACEMTAVAASGRLTDQLAEALGQGVQRFPTICPILHGRGDDRAAVIAYLATFAP